MRFSCMLVGLALLSPPLAATADELKADPDAGKALLAEGDKLADKNETVEAVLKYKQAFEHLLPGMRKLPFRREVKRDVTPREQMKDVLLKELDSEMTPEEFHGQEVGMKALGLIPREMDFKEVMVRVYSEEIAAFYDPRTDTMHLIKEPEAKARKKPGFFERLLGAKEGFDKDENKTVIAHELTHALADQTYDLEKLHDATKGDDDRSLALASLIEGEATLTMIGAQMEDWDGDEIAELPAAGVDRMFSFLGPFLGLAGGAALREAPPILAESMIFPYLKGMVFCARLTNDGGWKALDAAYENPPLSTEQILHPDKYLRQVDAPMAVDLGTLDAGPGWKDVGRNVLGELQTSILLRRHDGKAAAGGWDGDAYAAFEGPGDRLGLVWRTTWDTEDDAREFARSYARFQTTKLGPDAPEPTSADSCRRTRDGAVFAVERRGADVAVVEGFPEDTTESLVKAALAAETSEKTQAPVKKP